ncbi:MAG: universal stress protein, partial [Myxococcota bacterium]
AAELPQALREALRQALRAEPLAIALVKRLCDCATTAPRGRPRRTLLALGSHAHRYVPALSERQHPVKPAHRPLRWLVGIDARDCGAGATSMAQWVARRAPSHEFIGVHVVEDSWRRHLARVAPNLASPGAARAVAAQLGKDPGLGALGSVDAVPAANVVEGLAMEAQQRDCDVLLVGRRAPGALGSWVRLGRVARQLLRRLPTPVVVVPPDLQAPPDAEPGPILVATDLTDTSAAAARFASLLAGGIGADVLLTHVTAVPDAIPRFVPGERWAAPMEEDRAKRTAALLRWRNAHQLSGSRTSVVDGSVGPRLLDVAAIAGASMIVVGSRRLSLNERIVQSSVGSELSANAGVPVAVVPPEWSAHAGRAPPPTEQTTIQP